MTGFGGIEFGGREGVLKEYRICGGGHRSEDRSCLESIGISRTAMWTRTVFDDPGPLFCSTATPGFPPPTMRCKPVRGSPVHQWNPSASPTTTTDEVLVQFSQVRAEGQLFCCNWRRGLDRSGCLLLSGRGYKVVWPPAEFPIDALLNNSPHE